MIRDLQTSMGIQDSVAIAESDDRIYNSSYSWYWSLYDAGNPDNPNQSDSGTDNPGEYYEYHRDAMPFWSNSTYAIITPEMVDDRMPLPFYDMRFPIQLDQPDAVLDSRNVTTSSGTYDINNQALTLNTIQVSSLFVFDHSDNYNESRPYGQDGTQEITMNTTVNLDMEFWYEMVFDADTGMILEVNENRSSTGWMKGFAYDIQDSGSGQTVDVSEESNFSNFEESWMTLSSHSSMYGETRPESTGANRIEAGDTLNFDLEVETKAEATSDFFPGGMFEEHIDGSARLDAFYHEPGYFKAVAVMEGDFSTLSPDQDPQAPPFFDVDIMETHSNDSFEIEPFIGDYFHPQIDDMKGLDGPDGSPGGFEHLFYLFPHELPMTDMKEYNEFETYEINGFEYVVDALIIEGIYHFEESRTEMMYSPEGQDFPINYDITADASVKLYYDSATGVLMDIVEKVDFHISGDSPDVPGTATIDFSDRFELEVSDHPHEYQTEQTEFPEGYHNSTDGTNDTRFTGIGLPLPVSPVPIVGAVVFMALVIRRKKL